MASLLFAAPDAQAGTWLLQVSGSGSATATGKKPKTWTAPTASIVGSSFTAPSLSNGQGTGVGGSATASANLTVTVSGTWQPDATLVSDPPPTSVIVTETSTAYASDTSTDTSGNATPPVAGTADDGLNHGDTQSTSGANVGTMTGTKYEVNPGGGGTAGSFSVTITAKSGATATAGPNGTNPDGTSFVGTGTCTAGVGAITISASPVTVDISGTNAPAQGDYRALTGQQITGTLNGTIGTVTSYTLSFSGGTKGNPIKNWDTSAPGDGIPTQLVPFAPADLSQTDTTGNGISIKPIIFYDEIDQDSVTAKCVVNLIFPDSTTQSVTATSPAVTFTKPTVTAWGVNTGAGVQKGVPSGGPQVSGSNVMYADEIWGPVTINEPKLGTTTVGGQGCIIQIITADADTALGSAVTYVDVVKNANGKYVASQTPALDTGVPFPFGYNLGANGVMNLTNTGSSAFSVSQSGYSGDEPDLPMFPGAAPAGNTWSKVVFSSTYNAYVMYQPPGGIWVPLQKLTWVYSLTAKPTPGGPYTNPADQSQWAVSSPVFSGGVPANTDTPPSWVSVEATPLYFGPVSQ